MERARFFRFLAHDRLTLPTPRGFVPDLRVPRSGELGDGAAASRFLSDVIETMIRRGQRGRWRSPTGPSAPTNVSNSPETHDQNGFVLPPESVPSSNVKIGNHEMSANDGDLVDRMAKNYSVSPGAVQVVLAALRSGGGRMAQFSHADFGECRSGRARRIRM